MKKFFISFLAVAFVATMGLVSCVDDPVEPVEPEDTFTASDFAGQYNLHIDVQHYYIDNEEVEEPTEGWNGWMTISETTDPDEVRVQATVNLSGTEVQIYNTTAFLNADNQLQMVTSNYSNPQGLEFRVTYQPADSAAVLEFGSAMETNYAGYDIRYEMFNTASKK